MEEIWTIQTIAVSVSIITLIIIAYILQKILTEIRQLNNQTNIDKSLQLKYENMKAQNNILMTENSRVMEMAEDLAILLSQKKNNQ